MGKGGGGGGTTQSTGTTYNTNIPEYARPYVETMLGATQKQLFEGNSDKNGNFNITGFKPYQPYSTNPSDYVAGFSPMQQQAQRTVAGLQTPGEFGAATDITGAGIMGAMGTAGQAQGLMGMGNMAAMSGANYAQQATDPNAMGAYMSPYMQGVVDVQQREAMRQSNMQKMADQAQASKAGAFGGSRQGLVEAERQRNLSTQLGGIQAQGLQNAFQNAQQAQQFGANLNLQGLQAGAGMYGQGIGAQQAAYNQAMQGANQLANIGNQRLQAQTNIANLQNTYGAQQQASEQQKINQAIQDWANKQQYPLMQLGVMSNMLRGLPMQASTTNQYVAAPNPITQGIGAAGSAASLYNAFKAKGGVIKEMASGGIASVPGYSVGGEVADQLENMSVEQLQKEANGSSSPTIRAMAKRILTEKQMEQAEASKGTGPTGPMGVDYQAAPVQAAAGGILAFKEPTKANNYSLVEGEDGSQIFPVDTGPKMYDVGNDPDVKATTSAFMGASQSGHQPSIDAYRAKMEDAVTNAQARAAADEQTRLDMTYRAQKGIGAAKPEPQVRESAGIPQAVPRGEMTRPQLETAEGVASRTPAQQAEQNRLAAIYEKQRPAAPAAAPTAEAQPATASTRPAPAAPAKEKAGIMQAAPAAKEDDLLTTLKAKHAEAQKEAERPIDKFYEEQQALREKLGIGEDKGAQEQRAKLMAERANTKDEAERQRWMRTAEFFAAWGSTPGPTLAAGLNALQKAVPGMISDKKEQKKLERELDKAMYDIDHAIRLEKKGDVESAIKAKEKAADRVERANERVWSYQQGMDVAREHTRAEGIRASSAAADRQANREAQADLKKQDQYRNSLTNQTNVLAEIAREKQGKEYLKLVGEAKYPDTAKGPIAKARDEARAKLAEIEAEHDQRVRDAKETVKYFAGRAGVPESEKTAPAPKAEPAKVERPSWVPEGAQQAQDGNWYVREGRKYRKVVQNKE